MRKKRIARREPNVPGETNFGEVWEVSLPPCVVGGRTGLVSTLQQRDCGEGRRQ